MDVFDEPVHGAHDDGLGEDLSAASAAPAAPLAPRRVLAGGLLDRLAMLNRARRALRDMNLRIARVVWLDGRPCVEIEREPSVSLAPLLDRMGRRVFRCVDGRIRIAGEFEGVTVCWFELSNEGAVSGELFEFVGRGVEEGPKQ